MTKKEFDKKYKTSFRGDSKVDRQFEITLLSNLSDIECMGVTNGAHEKIENLKAFIMDYFETHKNI